MNVTKYKINESRVFSPQNSKPSILLSSGIKYCQSLLEYSPLYVSDFLSARIIIRFFHYT